MTEASSCNKRAAMHEQSSEAAERRGMRIYWLVRTQLRKHWGECAYSLCCGCCAGCRQRHDRCLPQESIDRNQRTHA
eukprot:3014934-Amphidinium_carterae.1